MAQVGSSDRDDTVTQRVVATVVRRQHRLLSPWHDGWQRWTLGETHQRVVVATKAEGTKQSEICEEQHVNHGDDLSHDNDNDNDPNP